MNKLFGTGSSVNFGDLRRAGAVILDVRSPGEFIAGHIKGALNINVENLENRLQDLPDHDKVIITCCASGGRSARAYSLLKSKGYVNVHDGGGWYILNQKL